MKVYIQNQNYQNIKVDKIKKYLTKKTTSNYIFSSKGIFQIYKNNKLMRLEIDDISSKKYTCCHLEDNENGIELIIDYSKFKFDEETQQLPFEHFVENIISYEYSLRPGGQVHLVVEYMDKDTDKDTNTNTNTNTDLPIKDFYFLANDDINFEILNEDIISFLVELKLC